jgi:hypothetical protein
MGEFAADGCGNPFGCGFYDALVDDDGPVGFGVPAGRLRIPLLRGEGPDDVGSGGVGYCPRDPGEVPVVFGDAVVPVEVAEGGGDSLAGQQCMPVECIDPLVEAVLLGLPDGVDFGLTDGDGV